MRRTGGCGNGVQERQADRGEMGKPNFSLQFSGSSMSFRPGMLEAGFYDGL
jgi:hypothetical protein